MSLRRARGAGWTMLVVSFLVAVIFSPAALGLVTSLGSDWPLLADVGQAYGGISAIVSALALASVGLSLILQSRQHRLERIATVRGMQFQIYDVVRSAPDVYGSVIGLDASMSGDEIRRRTLQVQFIRYVASAYEIGAMSEASLRSEVLPGFFADSRNCHYWSVAEPALVDALSGSRRSRQFVKIALSERVRAEQQSLARSATQSVGRAGQDDRPDRGSPRRGPLRNLVAALMALMVVLGLGWLKSRSSRCGGG